MSVQATTTLWHRDYCFAMDKSNINKILCQAYEPILFDLERNDPKDEDDPCLDVDCLDLSTYFRINDQNSVQFERSLIKAEKNSQVNYLEGCTAPQYDTNQLHAATIVELIALERDLLHTAENRQNLERFNLRIQFFRVSELTALLLLVH
jgi:hypothetical protein